MITLGDLGLTPVKDTTPIEPVEDPNTTENEFALVTGSAVARTLMHTWSGDRLVSVKSPPGAGKSTLIIDLVRHLLHRTELDIVVASPTKRGMYDLTERLVDVLGVGENIPKVVFSHPTMDRPEGSVTSAIKSRHVTVRTVASCAAKPPPVDVLIIDEAYQSTFSQVFSAAGQAQQIVMVGDPGQIGPVNRVPVTFWDNSKVSPASRAPEGFANFDGIVEINLDSTYRVGQTTVDVIAPLYEFVFKSARPDRWLVAADGTRAPEITSVKVPEVSVRADQPLMKVIAAEAVKFIGQTVVDGHHEDGSPIESVIEEHDIAVVVAHNDQAQMVGAYINMLLGRGANAASESRIYVGTADRAQGGQWKTVVALDPVVGHENAGSHQLSAGRLCVMLSRHTHHLTWLHDGTWCEKFTSVLDSEDVAAATQKDASLCIDVRQRLSVHDSGREVTFDA
ncbi:AAA family ATPase [Aeromicrobium sp. 179-A 4D2 NHS]|uniref:AAA family ATPase n=1 Tax=Aeromicrobium sp. 179-A 4D2 NHS TaxID=3142375 RepID=UPI0039A0472B